MRIRNFLLAFLWGGCLFLLTSCRGSHPAKPAPTKTPRLDLATSDQIITKGPGESEIEWTPVATVHSTDIDKVRSLLKQEKLGSLIISDLGSCGIYVKSSDREGTIAKLKADAAKRVYWIKLADSK
jgi:hypothetical protein